MTKERRYRISVIAGDGIGPEVISEAVKTVETAAFEFGFSVEWLFLPYGAEHTLSTGEVLPERALQEIEKTDALLLGAIGDPRVQPGLLERGILLKLRFTFDQYVNLRPAKGRGVDAVVVRENTEDLYVGLGGTSEEGLLSLPVDLERKLYSLSGKIELRTDPKLALAAQVGFSTEAGVKRIARYAAQTALSRGESRLALATKSNAMPQLYGFFERQVESLLSEEYPGVALEKINVDALCYHLVRQPERFGTILCPNLFGDIVSDLLAGLAGGMGVAAGANIGDGLSMFEPVHGSAPDIAGTGRANPIAAILSSALMLRHLGEKEAASAIEKAAEELLKAPCEEERPIELGGTLHTHEVGERVRFRLKER